VTFDQANHIVEAATFKRRNNAATEVKVLAVLVRLWSFVVHDSRF
jgi:hypothetical protein